MNNRSPFSGFQCFLMLVLILLVSQQLKGSSYDREIEVMDTLFIDTSIVICPGTEFLFRGDTLREEGLYDYFFSGGLAQEDTLLFLELSFHFLPEYYLTPSDTSILLGESVDFSVQQTSGSSAPVSATWSPAEYFSCQGCTESSYSAVFDDTIQVIVVDENNCTQELSSFVEILSGCLLDKVLVPNIFTPNGDDINDTFAPIFPYGFQYVDVFQIYNRWGQLIHENTEPDHEWDGRIQTGGSNSSQLAPADIYYYRIIIKCLGERRVITGELTLAR